MRRIQLVLLFIIPLLAQAQDARFDYVNSEHLLFNTSPPDNCYSIICDEKDEKVILLDQFSDTCLNWFYWNDESPHRSASVCEWHTNESADNYGPKGMYWADSPMVRHCAPNPVIDFNSGAGFVSVLTKYQPDTFESPELDNTPCIGDSFVMNYAAGRIESTHSYRFGKFEIRARLDAVDGYWPAFWLFTSPSDSGRNMCGDEIDYFEFQGATTHNIPSNIWTETCDLGIRRQEPRTLVPGGGFDQRNWHTYRIEWDYFKIHWILDGSIIRTVHHFFGKDTVADSVFAIENCPQIDQTVNESDEILIRNTQYPLNRMKLILSGGVAGPGQYNTFKAPNPSDYPAHFDIDRVKITQCCGQQVESQTCGTFNQHFPESAPLEVKRITYPDNPASCTFFHIPNGKELSIEAQYKINFTPSTRASPGAYLHAKIEPYCSEALPFKGYLFNEVPFESHNTSVDEAIELESKGNSVYLVPNPSSGIVNVSLSNTEEESIRTILVFDQQGRLIKNLSMKFINSTQFQLHLENQLPGAYFIRVNTNLNSYTEKVIIQ